MISLLLSSVLLFCWLQIVSMQNLMFTVEPQSVVVRQGSPAILNCQTNIQTSNVLIQWRKGYGTSWIFDYRNKPYRLLSNHSLYFPRIGPGDEDVYFCAAHILNTQMTIYSNVAHITLAYISPNFTRSPLSITLREHQTAKLTCVSGTSQPLPSITWERNGEPITNNDITAQYKIFDQNMTSATLQLRNISILADTGHYRCVAINPLLPDQPIKSQEAFLKILPVDDRPQIVVHPVNKIAPINQPLHLDCIIVGNPAPVVYWLHNNMRLNITSNISNVAVYPNGSLVIQKVTLQDNGQYSCHGINSKGFIASSKIFVNVAYLDYIFKQSPKNQTVVNGSRVEMICEPPNHFPKTLSYKWYKNYRATTLVGRGNILSSGSLVINPVLKSDQGVYFCEATNDISRQISASFRAHLTVNVPPYFTSTPSDEIVILGRTLRLTCKAAGSPEPVLTWYHGDTLLSNTSRLTLGANDDLVLSVVNTNDAGTYKCSVENAAGKNLASSNVIVHAPPNGTIMPSDASAILGSDATFFCRFFGNPPPVTVWYFKRSKMETALRISHNSTRYIQSNERLIILNVTERDNGVFTCEGENIVGELNFTAALEVLVPAHVVIFPRNITVNESDVAKMTCGSYGNPKPKVTWSRNAKTFFNGSRVALIGENLRIRNIFRNDTGLYSCTVENYLRSQTSSAYLTVQVCPIIEELLGPSRVQWKQHVSFYCKSDGVPTPLISWFKDVNEIAYTTRIYAQDSVLYITSAGHNDTGNYTCEASNVVDVASMTKQLIVEVPPSRLLDVKFGEVSSTSIQVFWKPGFNGYSPITSYKLEWRHNSSRFWRMALVAIKSDNYTIEGLKPFTLYYVRVSSANTIGWSEPSTSIWRRTGEDVPSIPNNLQCRTVNSSSILLTWNSPSQPNGVIRKYRIQYGNHAGGIMNNVTTTVMTYHMISLRPFTWYKFRVQAATWENWLLWGNFTSYVSCQSGQAGPIEAPGNLSLISMESQSILARWQKIPAESANGIITGYYIQYKKTTGENYTKVFIAGNNTLEYNITGLHPWSDYVVQVAAITVALGPWSPSVTSRTLESVPNGPPNNIAVRAITSNSLSVNWAPPNVENHNGVILGYSVSYGLNGSREIKNLTSNETSLELSGLKIFTSYIVRVRAFTSVGFGPYSNPVMNRTAESYPGIVRGLYRKIANDSIIISWQPPSSTNGIIVAYTTYIYTTTVHMYRGPGTNITFYKVTTQSRNITSHVTQVVLNGIYGNVTYTLCVRAQTSVGYGPCSSYMIFTTNFTKQFVVEDNEGRFTPSIVDDHLPLIFGGTAIWLAVFAVVLVCWFLRRRSKKIGENEAKQKFNFQRHTFSMGSLDDGDSSDVSHGSKTNNAYSVDSSSVHSQTNPIHVVRKSVDSAQANPSNDFTAAPLEGLDGSPFRLRNNSLALGSEASSYDAPYSSVHEVGVDPSSVIPVFTATHSPRHFENPLYPEKQFEDTRAEIGSIDSHAQINPIYEPSYPHPEVDENPDDFQGGAVISQTEEAKPALNTHGVLVLPPPPPEYSDYDDASDETPHAYSQAVTDF